MLVKPIGTLFEGEEDPRDMSYLGTVEDNKDPEKLGRIRVVIQPYEGLKTEELPWACPLLGASGNSSNAGGINIPEVGSQVRVTFPNRNLSAPYYSGAELNKNNKTTFFDDDYPNTYGYKDSRGNFIKVNKATDTIQLQHASSTNVRVAPDGSVQVALSNGSYMTLSNQNNFAINIGSVSIEGTADGSLSIEADTEVSIKTPMFKVKADMVQTDGDISQNSGVSGSFWTFGRLVTVKDGLIVSIE